MPRQDSFTYIKTVNSGMVEEIGVPGENKQSLASAAINFLTLGSARAGFDPRRWEALWSVIVHFWPLGHRGLLGFDMGFVSKMRAVIKTLTKNFNICLSENQSQNHLLMLSLHFTSSYCTEKLKYQQSYIRIRPWCVPHIHFLT